MKRLPYVLTGLILITALFWFYSCGPTRPEILKIDPAYSEYVSGYTSGIVSRRDAVRIELVEAVPGLEKFSEKKLNSLFRIEPAVKGEVVAIGDRLIDFVPDEPLPSNQFYTVYFDLDEVAEVKEGYEEFAFQFSTRRQEFDVEINGLSNYNSYEIEYQELEGTVTSTDYEDTTVLKKLLKIDIDGTELKYRISPGYEENEFHFVVDSVRRKEKEQTITVSWNGKDANSFSRGNETQIVSGLGDFNVSNWEVSEEEDQSLELRFSEPLQAWQNLDGIITIEGVEGLTYRISQNIVTVYLPNREIGRREFSVSRGIKNSAGYNMNKAFSAYVTFHKPGPSVRLNGSGSILPNSQGLIMPFEAISLKSVDVRVIRIFEQNVHHFLQVNELDGEDELTRFGEIVAEKEIDLQRDKGKDLNKWNTFFLDLGKLIKAQPGAIYQVAIKFEKEDAICDCPEEPEEEGEESEPEFTFEDDPATWNEWNWHTWGFEGYSSWGYYGSSNTTPCDDSYYYGRAVKRNILASDIGMIFKLNEDKSANVILSDMVSTVPMAHATVEFYDYNRKEIASGVTDAQGMMSLKLSQKPFLMIAKKGSQRGYMKLTDGRVNSLSKFDVDGEVIQKGVKGYLYAERGVWRPGDSLYINFMLQDKLNKFPKNHPVTFEFYDPNGNIIHKVSTARNLNGVYDFRTATSESSPTGTYHGYVHVGNKEFSKSFKVETIKPNRLKIVMEPRAGVKEDSCYLSAAWLHGASARKLKTDVEVRLEPMKTQFKGFEKYVFDSPIRSSQSRPFTLFMGELDDNGEARFSNTVADVREASGMLRARYLTRVYEKSGEMSIDYSYAAYSPYNEYVGIKLPDKAGHDEMLATNKEHHFDFVVVNKEGVRSSTRKLRLRIFKLDWNWWYDGEEDLTDFTARNSAIEIRDTMLKAVDGKCGYDLFVPESEYGKYLFTVTDELGGHQTGTVVHFDWSYWGRSNKSDNEFASMLNFSTDKKSYVKGEMIKMTFPSPSAGRALVSVETSEKVVQKFWIDTKKGETTYSFPASAEMSPNAYLHVTLLQPHHATTNDLPIRLYGVVPVEVDDPNTHLHPVIGMKDKIRPESKASVTVKEQNGRKMTYTLALVDEGLLDLTHFETPEPWNTFYAREALGVQTWDMYDDVIGAYGGKMDFLYSVGGDGFGMRGNGPKANRFKPMVTFLGPFELPAGGSKTHKIDIPSYVGSVRVMVVARDRESYGRAEKTVAVRKPLMVLATLPRVLGPGESFNLPADIFAMEKNVKNVKVRLEVNDLFELTDHETKNIQFNDIGDEIVSFKVKTKHIGVGKVKIIATSGNETAVQEVEIDIRPSNPLTCESREIVLEPGKDARAELIMDGMPGTNSGVIEMSTLPAVNMSKRLGYLIHYPHGCVEQTTSSVFPQLYLGELVNLTEKEQVAATANIKAGIERLQYFQTADGGMSYWPGENTANEWGTNYAGHFLLEAELAGYRLPVGWKERWLTCQKELARNWQPVAGTGNGARDGDMLTQAYRLYLLALARQPESGAMNRLREEPDLPVTVRWRLASAYALTGQPEVAKKLTADANGTLRSYREHGATFGSDVRDKAIILEVQAVLKENVKGAEKFRELAKVLSSEQWLSTQETAYCLIAMARFARFTESGGVSSLSYSVDGENSKSSAVGKKLNKVLIAEKGSKRSVYVKNTGKSTVYLTVITEKVPVQGKEKKLASNLEMSVTYTDMNGKKLDPDKVKQGTEFIAEVKVRHPGKKTEYDQMALNQIFPSGWEIRNTRLYNAGIDSDTRYQDIRDDRVLSYYSLQQGENKTIRVVLHATYQGRFYLPAVYSEAMYDHTIHAQVPGRWIEVVPE